MHSLPTFSQNETIIQPLSKYMKEHLFGYVSN